MYKNDLCIYQFGFVMITISGYTQNKTVVTLLAVMLIWQDLTGPLANIHIHKRSSHSTLKIYNTTTAL